MNPKPRALIALIAPVEGSRHPQDSLNLGFFILLEGLGLRV